jgi:hypothetical protein
MQIAALNINPLMLLYLRKASKKAKKAEKLKEQQTATLNGGSPPEPGK